jgi:phage tail sheath gpL-like
MSNLIPIAGISSDWLLPGAYGEILYGQGPATAAAPNREIIFVMPKTSAGTWTVNTLYQVRDEYTARVGAGVGSPAHRALRKCLMHNKDAKVWAVVYSATSGGSPAAATATVTLTGTVTAQGKVVVIAAGEQMEVAYASGATITEIGDDLVTVINAREHLPFTAGNVAGQVTLTARIAGVSQGTASVAVHQVHAEYTAGTGLSVAVSGALGSGTAGAEGTTTEAANLATALAAIAMTRKYYICVSVTDATAIGNLRTHIVTKSEPKRGLRSVGIASTPVALATAITLATGRNYERLSIVWNYKGENSPDETVGAVAALIQKAQALDSSANLNDLPLNDILLPIYLDSDRPNEDDLNDALNGGLAPIASTDGGTRLVMWTTTRSKNAAGTVNDRRALIQKRVSVTDEFMDETLVHWALNYQGKKLKDNSAREKEANALLETLIPNVITPISFKPPIVKRMRDYENAGKLENVDASIESLRVVKETTAGRLGVSFDLDVIEDLSQATFRVAEVSSG